MTTKWCWVKLETGEKTWAESDKYGYWIPGYVRPFRENEVLILIGPLSEKDIDNAYFNYWV